MRNITYQYPSFQGRWFEDQQFSFWASNVGQASGLPVRGASGPSTEWDAPPTGGPEARPTLAK